MTMSRSTPRRQQNRGSHPNQPSLSHPHSHSHSPQSRPNPNPSSQQQQNHGQGHSHSHVHGHGHLRNRSQQIQAQEQNFFVASDYESDTAHYMASHPATLPAALAARTNTELNLSVLQRYVPSISSILSIAANAVVYTFQPPTEWKKSNIEGPMFICSQKAEEREAGDHGCLFILNRKGLQNYVLDLNAVSDFELATDLLIFNLGDQAKEVPMENGEAVLPKVLGLWTYAEDQSDRQTNADLIYEMWIKVREAREQRTAAGYSDAEQDQSAEVGPAAQAMSRRVSISDLFRAHNGNGGNIG
ncbi:hypothetical protein F5X96DRAFT_348337 [Biscogniauxia mediterranea]|nr:hypothetical protein F5X96DRAFT_348337 [Biscogniauxia mediterranea]